MVVVGWVLVSGAVVGVDELLVWSLWKKLVIVLVLDLRGVFFFVFLVLFVGFVAGWRRPRVDLLLEMDGAEVMSGSEVVALMRLVEVGCRGAVERLRSLVWFETVGKLVGVGNAAVVMGDLVVDGGSGV